jgi:hypothetical protein
MKEQELEFIMEIGVAADEIADGVRLTATDKLTRGQSPQHGIDKGAVAQIITCR